MPVTRIRRFLHLRPEDLRPPEGSRIFFEPPDTEVAAWVGADLLRPGGAVLDLGSGSGAASAAFVRRGAAHVHGVDASPESVSAARRRHAEDVERGRLCFVVADFVTSPTDDLLAACPPGVRPEVVTCNPPYVPLPEATRESFASINGGGDGLRYLPAVVRHAEALDADLGISLGSHSCPRRAAERLAAHGLSICTVTLTPLPCGPLSRRNPERFLELEGLGEAFLRRAGNELGYVAVGLACRRRPAKGQPTVSPEALVAILAAACRCNSPDLEALDALEVVATLPIRVLALPDVAPAGHF